MDDPLASPLPAFGIEDVRRLLGTHFGVTATGIVPLAGERDQNFRVDDRYVLKITNPADGQDVLDMQVQALRHIERADPGLPVMRVLPGEPVVSGEDGRDYPVRLYRFLPGHATVPAERTPALLRGYGEVTARLGQALRGFFHPAAGYRTLWHLTEADRLRELLPHVADAESRARAERILDSYDARVAPVLPGLRGQVIHADISPDNVLVGDDGEPSGIIDFGDMAHQPLVCDLAVAVSDLLWGLPDPIAAAPALIAGYTSVTPLDDAEAGVLADLVATRLAIAMVIGSWRDGSFSAATSHYLEALERGKDPFRWVASGLPYRPMRTPELITRRRREMPRAPMFYDDPVHIVRGEGTWLFDADGNRYLDAYNNVPSVGHAHPRVTSAIAAQQRLLAVHSRYPHEALIQLAERLRATLPPSLDSVFILNSGSEANDLAWRVARAATGRDTVVVTEFAYHGVTEATHRLSPEEWADGETHPEVTLIPVDGEIPDAAALYLDPVCTSDGILAPPPERVAALAAGIQARGGLFIADEVQAGHGRTGDGLWSFSASGAEPDMVTAGKAMGAGFPVAMLALRSDQVAAVPERTELFSTFGGNPVACVAALAVLDVIEDEGLVANAARTGEYLMSALRGLGHPAIRDVRGRGLLIGVEFATSARPVVNALRHRGVLVSATGPRDNVLKIRPPLVFTAEHADLLLERLGDVLG
jgi:4-aminobutyrate aminotransferase-like enzyme/Ser/Thr protein kinase RdoA (MazF antagonist)